MPNTGQPVSNNMQMDIKPYQQRRDGHVLFIEAFGPVKSLDLTDYCNKHPEITTIIVQCDVPATVSKIKAYLQRSIEIHFEKGKPSTCLVDVPLSTSKKRKEIEPLPVAVAANPISTTTSTTQFVLPQPLARPTSTMQLPPPFMQPVIMSYQTSISTMSRSSEGSISPTLSDDVTDEVQVLAAMGYSLDEYNALKQKEYQLDTVLPEFRAVTQKLAELKRSQFRVNNKVARTHQIIGLSEYLESYSKGKKNALFEYATGSGKTFMFTVLAQAFLDAHRNTRKNKVIILVPMLNLRDQTEESFKNLDYSVIASSDDLARESRSTTAKVIIMTYQLAFVDKASDVSGVKKQQMQTLFASSNLVVIDEAHSAISYFNNADAGVKRALESAAVLAFTATPQFNLISSTREDNDAMKLVGHSRDENPITPFNIVAAIKSKANCPVKNFVVMLAPGQQNNSVLNANVDCDSKNVVQLIDSPQYNRLAADILINAVDDKNKPFRERKSIVFCASIQHANNMLEMIAGIPNVIELVDPDESKRMHYAYNLLKSNSDLDYQNDEIAALIQLVASIFKSKISSDEIVRQCELTINSSNKAGLRNKSLALHLISKIIREAKATFKVAATIHSKSKNSVAEQEQYKLGGVWFLFGDKMLDTGFDDPATSNVFRIKPTNSTVKSIQGGGRGLRLDPEDPSKVCTVIDIDLGLKGQKFFYENLGLDEIANNPTLCLGDVSRQNQYTAGFVRHTWADPVPAYTMHHQFSGTIELNFKALRKEARQKEALDALRDPKTGTRVILGATLERFNQTLLALDELNKKLRAKVATAEIKVSSNTSAGSTQNGMKLDDGANASTTSNKKPRNPRKSNASENVRITRDMKAQMKQGVIRAQDIMATIEDFFAMLDPDMQQTDDKIRAKKSRKSAVQHTSNVEVSIDKELMKFQIVAGRLATMVNKLNHLIKADSMKPNVGVASTTDGMPLDLNEGEGADAERAALLELIENLNEIDNSTILSDEGMNQLLQVQQRKREEAAQRLREIEEQKLADQRLREQQALAQQQVVAEVPQPETIGPTLVQVNQNPSTILTKQDQLYQESRTKQELLFQQFREPHFSEQIQQQLTLMKSTLTIWQVHEFFQGLRNKNSYAMIKDYLANHPELLKLTCANDFLIDAFRSGQINVLDEILKKKPELIMAKDRDGNHVGLLACTREYRHASRTFFLDICTLNRKYSEKLKIDRKEFYIHVNNKGMNMFHMALLFPHHYASAFPGEELCTALLAWYPDYIKGSYEGMNVFLLACRLNKLKLAIVLLKANRNFESEIPKGLALLQATQVSDAAYTSFQRQLEDWKVESALISERANLSDGPFKTTAGVMTVPVPMAAASSISSTSQTSSVPRNSFFAQKPISNQNQLASTSASVTNQWPQPSSAVPGYDVFLYPFMADDDDDDEPTGIEALRKARAGMLGVSR